MKVFPVADAHCDFLYYMANKNWDIATHTGAQCIHLPYMREGGVAIQFFAAWMDADLEEPYRAQCMKLLDAYDAMLAKHNEELTPFTKDFSPDSGKIGCVLTVEGGEAIEGNLDMLDVLYARGVRAMTLTWNYKNELAHPATGIFNRGLTKLGKAAVERMSDLGIAIDTAHLNEAGIDDVLERATRPVFASHSNARALYDSKRSLKDRQIRDIVKTGGMVCVNFYPRQLCKGDAKSDDVVAHIDHIAALVGAEHVGIGSDFDGMNCFPRDIHNSRDFPILWEKLLRMGYLESDVRRIAYDNLRDYIALYY